MNDPKQYMEWLKEQLNEIAQLPPQEIDANAEKIKVYRDNLNVMRYAFEEARKKGLKKGFVEGLREALQKRRVKGEKISPQQEKMFVAKKLLTFGGFSMKEISSITELCVDDIESL